MTSKSSHAILAHEKLKISSFPNEFEILRWCNRCTWSSQPPQVPKGFADSTPAVHVCASEALAKAKVIPNKIHFIVKVIENGILQYAGKWGMGMKFWLCHLIGLISCHKFMALKKISLSLSTKSVASWTLLKRQFNIYFARALYKLRSPV